MLTRIEMKLIRKCSVIGSLVLAICACTRTHFGSTTVDAPEIRVGSPVMLVVRSDQGPGEPIDGVRIEVSSTSARVVRQFEWISQGKAEGQMVFATAGTVEVVIRLWVNDSFPLVERHNLVVLPATE